jgi:hypothetical protein
VTDSENEDPSLTPAAVLGLPSEAPQMTRIHKKTLIEQAASQPADAALITRVVSSAWLVAVLHTENVKISAYVDEQRRVDDIAVLQVELHATASSGDVARLIELLHRSMPRPLVLFVFGTREGSVLSLALTHLNLGDPDRATSVVDQSLVVPLNGIPVGALRLDALNRSDLWALYRDLVRVAAAGGHPASAALSAEAALDLRARLTSLETELAAVVREAKREKSQAGRINLNTRARELRLQIEHLADALSIRVLSD